ncbi:hypothetical protein CMQ_594 [Grosmannia clavigera kw1407]|uniref:Uncharacterized protein n=1 Tax=Grosmannia clavigera (strain kw1407 / UAMH 11150) TaxID=655863 RepID=F0XDT6_GROCL|nr:uncharacterized protein CMQ_594 [Grosmannia clavigera kw1407]EFX03666.1 hypothetical protein CMQ_594 [Grosmannia clavigera kw1407]
MDSSAFDYLQGLLPDPVLTLLDEHVVRSDAPLHLVTRAVASQLTAAASATAAAAQPYTASMTARLVAAVTPLLDRAARAAYDAPDVVVLGAVFVLLLFVLRLLSLVRRLVAWWTRMLFRLLFWSGVVLVLAAMWQRGLEQSTQDAAALTGRLVGYGAFVRDVWQSEYHRYQQQQVQAQAQTQAYRVPSGSVGASPGSSWSRQ